MSRTRQLVVVYLAVVASSAALVDSAFASGQWYVNGTPLAAHATVGLSNALGLEGGKASFRSGAETIEIVCKGHEIVLNNGMLIGPDGVLASSIVYHECRAKSAAENCQLASSLITTVPVHALADLDGTTAALLLGLPATKTTFLTLRFEGELCGLPETLGVTGGLDIVIHEATTSLLLHRTLTFSLRGGLFVGSSEAELTGVVNDLHLTSDLPWRFL